MLEPRIIRAAAAVEGSMQFHVLSFEGPDAYARAGGLASRVCGLSEGLARAGHDTHLWFVGDPDAPGIEERRGVHLHRWCQWISAHHRAGVYDGEHGKLNDYAASLPQHLFERIAAARANGTPVTVLAEEWHTASAVLGIDALLRKHDLRDQVQLFWNANNTFGFDCIDWNALQRAAKITTVSRYMRLDMRHRGIDALVIPNGLEPSAFEPIAQRDVVAFAQHVGGRPVLAKVARFDPDKCWLASVEILAELRRRGQRPLLIARGGLEDHGREVLAHARAHGLRIAERVLDAGADGLLHTLAHSDELDVLLITSHVDAEARRLLFRSASAVLANSSHEPFGLVGLEAMAAHGIACTGISGEDYAVSGHNAVVLQTGAPGEAVHSIEKLLADPGAARAMRQAAGATATHFAWQNVITRNLLPRIELGLGPWAALGA